MKHQGIFIPDAQAALGFVTHQRSHIEAEVLQVQYPEITYSQMIPVDTSAADYAPSVTFFSQDSQGQAKFINGKADDIPTVNMTENKFEQTVHMAAIAYSFSLEEIGAAQQMGRNLSSDGADAATRASEQLADELAFVGNAQLGTEGIYNTTGIQSVASAGLFSALTPDQILTEINDLIGGILSATKQIDMPNVCHMPIAVFTDISSRRIPDTNMTILEFLQRSNAYTATTGQQMEFRGTHRLTTSLVMYRRDPQVVKMHMPMPLQFIAPQAAGLEIVVHGMMRIAPPSIRRPGAFRYLTGVAS